MKIMLIYLLLLTGPLACQQEAGFEVSRQASMVNDIRNVRSLDLAVRLEAVQSLAMEMILDKRADRGWTILPALEMDCDPRNETCTRIALAVLDGIRAVGHSAEAAGALIRYVERLARMPDLSDEGRRFLLEGVSLALMRMCPSLTLIEKAAASPNWQVRYAAAFVVRQHPGQVQALRAVLGQDTHPDVRWVATARPWDGKEEACILRR